MTFVMYMVRHGSALGRHLVGQDLVGRGSARAARRHVDRGSSELAEVLALPNPTLQAHRIPERPFLSLSKFEHD